ncbi:HIT domain-containing protein [Bacteroidetes/Chlorobi group bacterium Naka2016]|jgi:ATP adenylyltransferase|nr:MAG: HIT domain-containing protein [Bacteroidetes/Chlorobi group bacterium Naka2016]
MEILWSPWRTKYIESFSEKDKDNICFICEAVNLPNEGKERLVVHRTNNSIVLMNKFPYNAGHLLVSPLKHTGTLDDLNQQELLDLIATVRFSIKVLQIVMKPHGFNVGINIGRVAGAGLPDHIHFHIIPRWNGDTSFISVISDTKVISQSMEEIYEKLSNLFRTLKDDLTES